MSQSHPLMGIIIAVEALPKVGSLLDYLGSVSVTSRGRIFFSIYPDSMMNCPQIDHKYEERRLLVAQSCGELGQLVGSEMRTSLVLSIIQQLASDPASVVREAASHNLAVLLPLFNDMDKYYKVSLAVGPTYGAAF